jgi:transcriptional regulator with XRE-family HTH domain
MPLPKGPYLGTFTLMKNSKKALNDYKMAISTLKMALKQRGLTYRELGKSINLSESGVKKIFLADDGSFLRLAQIARFLGLSLTELVSDQRMTNVGFSEAQQSEFVNNPLLFKFYFLLVYERADLTSASKDLKLTNNEAFKLARKLDVLGLIKLLPGERLIVPSIKAVSWKGTGDFLAKLYRDWSTQMMSQVAKPDSAENELFILRYIQMTPKTYAEFVAAHRALEAEFMRRSVREMQLKPNNIQHVRWITATDNRSYVTGKFLN